MFTQPPATTPLFIEQEQLAAFAFPLNWSDINIKQK